MEPEKKRKCSPSAQEAPSPDSPPDDPFPFEDLPPSAAALVLAAAGIGPFLEAAPSLGRQVLSASEDWGTVRSMRDLDRLCWILSKSNREGSRNAVPPGSLSWSPAPETAKEADSKALSRLGKLSTFGWVRGLGLEGPWITVSRLESPAVTSLLVPILASKLVYLDLSSILLTSSQVVSWSNLLTDKTSCRDFTKLTTLVLPLEARDNPSNIPFSAADVVKMGLCLPSLTEISLSWRTTVKPPCRRRYCLGLIREPLSTPAVRLGALKALLLQVGTWSEEVGFQILATALSDCILARSCGPGLQVAAAAMDCLAAAFNPLHKTSAPSLPDTFVSFALTFNNSGALDRLIEVVRDPAADPASRRAAGRAVARLIVISFKVEIPSGTSWEEWSRIDRQCGTNRAPLLAATVPPLLDVLRRDADVDRTGAVVALSFFLQMLKDLPTEAFMRGILSDLGALCCRRLTASGDSAALPAPTVAEIDLMSWILLHRSRIQHWDDWPGWDYEEDPQIDEADVKPAIRHLLSIPGLAASALAWPQYGLFEALALLLGPDHPLAAREETVRCLLAGPRDSVLGERLFCFLHSTLHEVIEGTLRVAGETLDSQLRSQAVKALLRLSSAPDVHTEAESYHAHCEMNCSITGAMLHTISGSSHFLDEDESDEDEEDEEESDEPLSAHRWRTPAPASSRHIATVCLATFLLQNPALYHKPQLHAPLCMFDVFDHLDLLSEFLEDCDSSSIVAFLSSCTMDDDSLASAASVAGLDPALLREARLTCLTAVVLCSHTVVPSGNPEGRVAISNILPTSVHLADLVSDMIRFVAMPNSLVPVTDKDILLPEPAPSTGPAGPNHPKFYRRRGPFPTVRLAFSAAALDLLLLDDEARGLLLANDSLFSQALKLHEVLEWDGGLKIVYKIVQRLLKDHLDASMGPLMAHFFSSPSFLARMPLNDGLGGPFDMFKPASAQVQQEPAPPAPQGDGPRTLPPVPTLEVVHGSLCLIDQAASSHAGMMALLQIGLGSLQHASSEPVSEPASGVWGFLPPDYHPGPLLVHLMRLTWHKASEHFPSCLAAPAHQKTRSWAESIFPYLSKLLMERFVLEPTDMGREAVARAFAHVLQLRADRPATAPPPDTANAAVPPTASVATSEIDRFGLSRELVRRASGGEGPAALAALSVNEARQLRAAAMRHLAASCGRAVAVSSLFGSKFFTF